MQATATRLQKGDEVASGRHLLKVAVQTGGTTIKMSMKDKSDKTIFCGNGTTNDIWTDNAYNNVSVPSDYVKFRSRYSNEDLLNLLGNETQKPWIFSVSTYSGNTQIGNTYSATGSYVIVRSTYDIAATAIVSLPVTLFAALNTVAPAVSQSVTAVAAAL